MSLTVLGESHLLGEFRKHVDGCAPAPRSAKSPSSVSVHLRGFGNWRFEVKWGKDQKVHKSKDKRTISTDQIFNQVNKTILNTLLFINTDLQ